MVNKLIRLIVICNILICEFEILQSDVNLINLLTTTNDNMLMLQFLLCKNVIVFCSCIH